MPTFIHVLALSIRQSSVCRAAAVSYIYPQTPLVYLMAYSIARTHSTGTWRGLWRPATLTPCLQIKRPRPEVKHGGHGGDSNDSSRGLHFYPQKGVSCEGSRADQGHCHDKDSVSENRPSGTAAKWWRTERALFKRFFYGYIINIYSTFSLECSACHVYPTLLNPQSCPVLTEAVTLWPRPCFPASAVPHSLATNCPGHEGVRPGQVYRVLSLSVSSQAGPTRLSGGTKAEVDSVPSSL